MKFISHFIFNLTFVLINLLLICNAYCEQLPGFPTSYLVIRDSSGNYIDNATVYINDVSLNDYVVHFDLKGISGEGLYEIYKIEDGEYMISASTPGYVTQMKTLSLKLGNSHFITLSPGKSIPKFLLSVENSNNGVVKNKSMGINCGEDCYELFDENSNIRLLATPNEGYRFDGWSGACTGHNDCVISMDSDQILNANFRKDNGVIIQPEHIDFGNVFPGDISEPRTITITNISNEPLMPQNIELTAESSSDFTILNNSCQNEIIQHNDDCVIQLRFNPSSVGLKNGQLDISIGSLVQLPLIGHGFQTIYNYERLWPLQYNFYYFDGLTAMAIDHMDHVYLVDHKINQVIKYNSSGRFITSWGAKGNDEGQFNSPIGIAASYDGYIYVADGKNYRIQKFDFSGEFITSWGSHGNSDGEFNWHDESHAGIVLDNEGFVYVADSFNKTIQKFSDTGEFISSFQVDGSIFDIAIDSGNNIYIVDNGNFSIKKYTNSGKLDDTWGGILSLDFFGPLRIDIKKDIVYILDYFVNYGEAAPRIQKYSIEGELLDTCWYKPGFDEGEIVIWMFEGLMIPTDIAVDSNGSIYEIESGLLSRVQKFSSDCSFIDQWSSQSTKEEEFHSPLDVVADQDNNIFVVDSFNCRVEKFTADGQYITSVYKNTEEDQSWPQGIVFDSDNNFYLLDGYNESFEQRIFDENKLINSFIVTGELTSSSGIAIDHQGFFYISSAPIHRIKKFSPSGEFVKFIGANGTSPGMLSFPQGIAFDSQNNLYVVDRNNNRIQKFTSDGNYILDWGKSGDQPGEFNNPRGIAIDNEDLIYVADTNNHRVQIFTNKGRFLTSIGTYGVTSNTFKSPQYLCFTSDNKLYVSDFNSRIQVFSKEFVFKSRKAIIVAGQRERGDALWNATQMCANYAYQVLMHQGYSDDTIYYLNASHNSKNKDKHSLLKTDDVPEIEKLKEAITEWAVDSKSLLLYFVDHGEKQMLSMTENVILFADELDEWLDIYQMKSNGMLTVILDACDSGNFLKPLASQNGQKRIVITSSSVDQPAQFHNDGTLSFSNDFWSYIFKGNSINFAFSNTKDNFENKYSTYRQDPLLDDDGDGIYDSKDGNLAKAMYIGNGLIQSISSGPEILRISESQTITNNSTVAIEAFVSSQKSISSVKAFILPDNTVTMSKSFELNKKSTTENTDLYNYKGTYNQFNANGLYRIYVYATDSNNQKSRAKLTSVTVNDVMVNRAVLLGSSFESDWPMIENNLNVAYNTLSFHLFTNETINVLSPKAIEDISCQYDYPNKENLTHAIEDIPSDKTKDVIIFLTGKGEKNHFYLNEQEKITVDELESLLDQLQNRIPGIITLIYDADYSGSFVNIADTEKYKRIVFCSTGDSQPNIEIKKLSFSNFFWTQVLTGKGFYDVVNNTRSSIAIYDQTQTPELEPILNYNIDGIASYTFGSGVIGGDLPVNILSIVPEQILDGSSCAKIWILASEMFLDIEDVWAEITFIPDGEQLNNTSSDSKTYINLNNCGNGKYSTVYTDFKHVGSYEITIFVKSTTGHISTPKTTRLIQNMEANSLDQNNDGFIDLKDSINILKNMLNVPVAQRNMNQLKDVIMILKLSSNQWCYD